jgi:hypothetical protein
MQSLRPIQILAAAALLMPPLAARAATLPVFPPVTAEEAAYAAVPGEPNAPAVVLSKQGELLLAGYGRLFGSFDSHLRVRVRMKILTAAGKHNGEVTVAHGEGLRLEGFAARTVLPDGRIVPVPANATFLRRTSESRKTFVTAVAFPAVEPGAILDYQYELVFSSPFVLEPWFLSEEIPVRHAEIVFQLAKHWTPLVWTHSPLGVKIEQQKQETFSGTEIRAWAENLPAVPDAPYGPAYADLASQIAVLPAAYSDVRGTHQLLGDWYSTTSLASRTYEQIEQHGFGVEGPAHKIAGTGDPRQKIEALYRYVRDEIRTSPWTGVLLDPELRLRKIFDDHRGSGAEKALVLQSMLQGIGIRSDLVWAGGRKHGTFDPTLPTPAWFDTVLVAVTLDGKAVFLDPSEPSLGFGQLRPGYEGTPALVCDRAQRIVLPEVPFDQNLRRAEVDLAVDDKGRLAGTGTLRLTGLRAVERLYWKGDEPATRQAWQDWLARQYPDFRISNLQAVEAPDERKVTVTWALAQREDEVLGDETTVVPSAPLGPAAQPFVQTAEERRLDVLFDYPYRDEVELHLRWPAGWKVERRPDSSALDLAAGALATWVVMNPADRTLFYRRRFEVTRRRLSSKSEYEAVRALFGAAAKSDGESVVLVHP